MKKICKAEDYHQAKSEFIEFRGELEQIRSRICTQLKSFIKPARNYLLYGYSSLICESIQRIKERGTKIGTLYYVSNNSHPVFSLRSNKIGVSGSKEIGIKEAEEIIKSQMVDIVFVGACTLTSFGAYCEKGSNKIVEICAQIKEKPRFFVVAGEYKFLLNDEVSYKWLLEIKKTTEEFFDFVLWKLVDAVLIG